MVLQALQKQLEAQKKKISAPSQPVMSTPPTSIDQPDTQMSNNLDKQASKMGFVEVKSNIKPNISEATSTSNLPSAPDQVKLPSEESPTEKQQKPVNNIQSENGVNHSQSGISEEAGIENNTGNGNHTAKMNGGVVSTNGAVQSHNGGLFIFIYALYYYNRHVET